MAVSKSGQGWSAEAARLRPDGPEIEMYSPRSMSSVTLSSAQVSVDGSSPANFFVTPSSRISGRLASAAGSSTALFPRFHQGMGPSRAVFDANRPAIVGTFVRCG